MTSALSTESAHRYWSEATPELAIDPESHLLVVAPHPDDEVIGFGGAISEHLRAGGRVTVVAVTDGEACDDGAGGPERQEIVVTRQRERAQALRLLGPGAPTVVRLGMPDGEVAEHENRLVERLRGIVASAGPGSGAAWPVVVSPWERDLHPDHEAVGRAAVAAVSGYAVHHLRMPVWAWYRSGEDPSTLDALDVSECRVVRVGDDAQRAKRAALACFQSQLVVLSSGRGPVLPAGFLTAFDRPFEAVIV